MADGSETRRLILECFTSLLDDLADGRHPQLAICTRVADMVNACAATHVAFAPATGTSTVHAWPLSVEAERIARAPQTSARHVLALDPDGSAANHAVVRVVTEPASGAQGPLREVLRGNEVVQVPLRSDRGQHALLVAFDESPTAHQLRVLRHAQVPLVALDRLVHSQNGPVSTAQTLGAARVSANLRAEPGLTEREVEVLAMLAEGLLARTIAARLAVSTRTVHKHLGNVCRKLEAHDRLAAVHRAQAIGLIPDQVRPLALSPGHAPQWAAPGGPSTHGHPLWHLTTVHRLGVR